MTVLVKVLLATALIAAMIVLRVLADRGVARDRQRLTSSCMRIDCAHECDDRDAETGFQTESDIHRSA